MDLRSEFKRRIKKRRVEIMNRLYCCYSLNLRNYLYENGLRYELAALNPNSQKLFWVYIKTKKLDELLTKWSAKK